jgi:hypothetical protein
MKAQLHTENERYKIQMGDYISDEYGSVAELYKAIDNNGINMYIDGKLKGTLTLNNVGKYGINRKI